LHCGDWQTPQILSLGSYGFYNPKSQIVWKQEQVNVQVAERIQYTVFYSYNPREQICLNETVVNRSTSEFICVII